jgi:hypothetical protein
MNEKTHDSDRSPASTDLETSIMLLTAASAIGAGTGLALGTLLWQKLLAGAGVWFGLTTALFGGWQLARLLRGANAKIEASADAGIPVPLAVMFPCAGLTFLNALFYVVETVENTQVLPNGGLDFEMPEYFAIGWAMAALSWLSVAAAKVCRGAWRSFAVALGPALYCCAACVVNAIWMQRWLAHWGR